MHCEGFRKVFDTCTSTCVSYILHLYNIHVHLYLYIHCTIYIYTCKWIHVHFTSLGVCLSPGVIGYVYIEGVCVHSSVKPILFVLIAHYYLTFSGCIYIPQLNHTSMHGERHNSHNTHTYTDKDSRAGKSDGDIPEDGIHSWSGSQQGQGVNAICWKCIHQILWGGAYPGPPGEEEGLYLGDLPAHLGQAHQHVCHTRCPQEYEGLH